MWFLRIPAPPLRPDLMVGDVGKRRRGISSPGFKRASSASIVIYHQLGVNADVGLLMSEVQSFDPIFAIHLTRPSLTILTKEMITKVSNGVVYVITSFKKP
jgi:hypothetical protein